MKALRYLQAIATLLMVLPFVFASLIPSGIMPVNNAENGLVMLICTGEGPVEMVLGEDGELTQVDTSGGMPSEADTCVWAINFHSVGLTCTSTLPVSITEYVKAKFAVVPTHLRMANVLEPSARGPPEQV